MSRIQEATSKIQNRLENATNKNNMTPLMHAIKAVHSVSTAGASVSPEDLTKQRNSQDLFSGLVTPTTGIMNEPVEIEGIPAEWAKPEGGHNTKNFILYCHGGGYTCGSLKYARILANKLSLHTGLEVLFFEYRLAPENPYPAAIEDALTIWNHLMLKGYGARDIIVAGDSAGGNLALELTLHLKENNRMLPRGLVLLSPWTDMTCSGPSYAKCIDIDPMLTIDYIHAVRGAYCGTKTDYDDPHVSPLFADFKDFPPTMVQVGSNEILKSDSDLLVKNLKKVNVRTEYEVFNGGWHVFQQMPLRKSTLAMESIGRFVWSLL